MNTPDIAFIINSFNRLDLLKECLKVLSNWIPDSEFKNRCAIIVYDAGSKDGSVEWLQDLKKNWTIPLEIILPEPGDDTSFSAGLNAGAAYAERIFPGLTYLLFYETDNQILTAEPVRHALTQIQETDRLAACGFTVRRHDGKMAGVGMSFPKLINFAAGKQIVHRFNLEAIPYEWKQQPSGAEFSYVDVVFTSPLLVRLDAWKESGGLDAKTFPFSDCDIDWARRLRALGWRMGVVKTDTVFHDNLQALSVWSKNRTMQFHRGRLRYFKRYHPVSVYLVWPVLLMFRHLMELVAANITVKQPERRRQLTEQFRNLLKRCTNGYESN